jgi:hypothetical protein
VILTDVLEHIAEPQRLMWEIGRILASQGKVVVTVPFFYWLHEEPHDYYRYTKYALKRFCDGSGLSILELTEYGGLPEVLFDLMAKGAHRFGAARLVNAAATLCRLKPNWMAEDFPLGYLLVAQKP